MRERRPNWREEALRKLSDPRLTQAEREEISRELAGYLEDLCGDASARGLDDSAARQIDATQSAAAELHEDANLGAHLYRARKDGDVMSDRTRQLWLPGVAMILASIGLVVILRVPIQGSDEQALWLHAGTLIASPVFWRFLCRSIWSSMWKAWCILPFLGAAGAYWSRRAGSRQGIRALVGLSPLLIFVGALAATVRLNLTVGAILPAGSLVPALAIEIVEWIVVPGVALLLGVLPFLRSRGDSQSLAVADHA